VHEEGKDEQRLEFEEEREAEAEDAS